MGKAKTDDRVGINPVDKSPLELMSQLLNELKLVRQRRTYTWNERVYHDAVYEEDYGGYDPKGGHNSWSETIEVSPAYSELVTRTGLAEIGHFKDLMPILERALVNFSPFLTGLLVRLSSDAAAKTVYDLLQTLVDNGRPIVEMLKEESVGDKSEFKIFRAELERKRSLVESAETKYTDKSYKIVSYGAGKLKREWEELKSAHDTRIAALSQLVKHVDAFYEALEQLEPSLNQLVAVFDVRGYEAAMSRVNVAKDVLKVILAAEERRAREQREADRESSGAGARLRGSVARVGEGVFLKPRSAMPVPFKLPVARAPAETTGLDDEQDKLSDSSSLESFSMFSTGDLAYRGKVFMSAVNRCVPLARRTVDSEEHFIEFKPKRDVIAAQKTAYVKVLQAFFPEYKEKITGDKLVALPWSVIKDEHVQSFRVKYEAEYAQLTVADTLVLA